MAPARTFARSDSFQEVQDIDFTLRRQFKKQSFRPNQREIILAALDHKDVFVQAATSFGKSLCFQLPAVLGTGITLVVSPLLSLMMDQVNALQRTAGVDARTLNSGTPPAERDAIYRDLESGHPHTRLLYVSPEMCKSPFFRRKLCVVHEQRHLMRVAVDEAHCISEWGHDFRPDFKQLSWFRETFPDVPIMCLTATANERVRQDVLSTLGLDWDRLECFTMTAHRPNLHLEIRYTSDSDDNDRFDNFVRWLRGVYARRRDDRDRAAELAAAGERPDNVPGIIYTTSRQECEMLAYSLRQAGIGARPFHARLTKEQKQDTLARWIADEPGWDVVVATTAFGMGIDKDNVRFVVHWRLPKSFEGYYQEAGRAGRDGRASYCFLYYSLEDKARVSSLVMRDMSAREREGANGKARQESMRFLVEYCENTDGCRHAAICRYFGETAVPQCDYACDVCKDRTAVRKRKRSGLASEEWVSTQTQRGAFDDYDYND